MSSKVSVALVGCGIGGSAVLSDLIHLGAEVIVVDAADEHRLEAIKLGADEAVSTMSELPKVKGIIIGSLARDHVDFVEEALEFGVPVLTEHPFSIDVEASRRLADVAPNRLFVMHTMRYHVGVGELAAIAAHKELGALEWIRITRTSWAHRHIAPNTTWNLLAQDLSIVLEILGSIPAPVLAIPEVHDGEVAGIMAALGETPRVIIEDSTRYADNRREVRLHCAEGVAILPDMTSGYIEITRNSQPGDRGVPAPERRQYATEQPMIRELTAFLDHVKNRRRKTLRSSVPEGLAVAEANAQLRTLSGW